ncbi:MAG: EutP/PduV family microcompartment system protein [Propionibacteriaceae bacterium]|jgi:ethanolamine utilization protein EutP|nr:EutP/PduV family microcompartment system protein [Propionibacteriaceae bacterium]
MLKAILVGISGCGKTTLIQRLCNDELVYKKTQVVEHYVNFIDTPGEYLEQRALYRGIIISAVDADEIGLVQDCSVDNTWIPPSFATTFAKPIFGIVTKTDLAKSREQIDWARSVLQTGGANRVFEVSALTGDGIQELLDYLEEGASVQAPVFRASPLRSGESSRALRAPSASGRDDRGVAPGAGKAVLSPEFGTLDLSEVSVYPRELVGVM